MTRHRILPTILLKMPASALPRFWSTKFSVDLHARTSFFFHCRTRIFNVFIVFSSIVKCCQMLSNVVKCCQMLSNVVNIQDQVIGTVDSGDIIHTSCSLHLASPWPGLPNNGSTWLSETMDERWWTMMNACLPGVPKILCDIRLAPWNILERFKAPFGRLFCRSWRDSSW